MLAVAVALTGSGALLMSRTTSTAGASAALAAPRHPGLPVAVDLPSSTTTTAPPAPPPAPPPANPVVLVVGDSIADFTAESLAEQGAPAGVTVIDEATWGCGVMDGSPLTYVGHRQAEPDECAGWDDRWREAVLAYQPHVTMLMIGRWEVVDRVVGGEWRSIGDPVFDAELDARLEYAVSLLAWQGGRVVLTTAPYFFRSPAPDGGYWPEDEPWRVDRFNALVRAVAARHPGVVDVADFGRMLSPGGQFVAEVNGVPIRRDGVHLTPEGSAIAAGWLLPQLVMASAPRAQ